MDSLQLSNNSKTKFSKNHYNTFGLNYGQPKNGGTCPGATLGSGGCLDIRTGLKRQTCYMAKIVQIYKAVGVVLDKNTGLLRGQPYKTQLEVLTNTFQKFVDENPSEHWYFRMTYSGDIFDRTFARALVAACKKFPLVQFWIYTRSHDYVEILSTAENLAVYLSVDPVNKDKGYKVYNKLKDRKNVGLAWLGNVPPTDGIKYITCPETSGKVKNTPDAGACSKCRLCFNYNDKIKLRCISFNIH